MRSSLLLLAFLFPTPAHAKLRPEPTPVAASTAAEKPARRYTMKDIDAQEPALNKFDRFLQTVGTLGLIYFWPGLRLKVTSDNTAVEINSR